MPKRKLEIEITQKGAKKAASEQKGLSASIGKTVKSLAAMAVSIAAAKKAYDSLSDSVKKASDFVTVSEAMERQFNKFSSSYVTALNKVSGGTISNYNLILAANKAMALGVTDNLQEMAKLLQFARLRARAMGITTTQAFNDISIGIGRGSALILDNLGITIKGMLGNEEAMQGASNQAKILSQVLKIANEELAKAGDLTNTTAENMQAYTANVENFKVAVGQAFIPLVNEYLPKVNELLGKVTEELKSDEGKAKEFAESMSLVNASKALSDVNVKLRETGKFLDEAKTRQQLANESLEAQKEALKDSKYQLHVIAMTSGRLSEEYKNQESLISAQKESIKNIKIEVEGINNLTETQKGKYESLLIMQKALEGSTKRQLENMSNISNLQINPSVGLTMPSLEDPLAGGFNMEYIQSWQEEIGQSMAQTMNESIAGGTADGLATGEGIFKKFLDKLKEDLIRSAIYQLIMYLLTGSTSGGSGGLIGSLIGSITGGGQTVPTQSSATGDYPGLNDTNIVREIRNLNMTMRTVGMDIKEISYSYGSNSGYRGMDYESLVQDIDYTRGRMIQGGYDERGSNSTL